ncbi:hypothetical protein IF2G_01552 [Cordyceps javanica]|nr:hypothetical protein IF2G_01552 [Cordyceps javanica]
MDGIPRHNHYKLKQFKLFSHHTGNLKRERIVAHLADPRHPSRQTSPAGNIPRRGMAAPRLLAPRCHSRLHEPIMVRGVDPINHSWYFARLVGTGISYESTASVRKRSLGGLHSLDQDGRWAITRAMRGSSKRLLLCKLYQYDMFLAISQFVTS